MKTPFLFIFTFVFFLSDFLFAQDSTKVAEEINNISLSKNQLRRSYEMILTTKLAQNDSKAIKDLVILLLQKEEQDNFTYLYIEDKIPLIYIAKQYENLSLALLDKYAYAIDPDFSNPSILSTPLQKALFNYFNRNKADLQAEIKQHNLSQDAKDFHILSLQFLAHYSNRRNIYSKYPAEINQNAATFLQKYPNSLYTDYVRKYVYREYMPSKWGNYIGLGLGYNSFSQNLGQKFNNAIDFHIHYELHYKKVFANVGMKFIFSSVQQDIDYSNGAMWQKDASAQVIEFPITAGFWLWDNRVIRILPFAGISGLFISPNSKEPKAIPNSKALRISALTYTFGVNLDFKIGEKKTDELQYYHGIRVGLAYIQPNFWGYSPNFNGQMYCISLSYGGFEKFSKRKRYE